MKMSACILIKNRLKMRPLVLLLVLLACCSKSIAASDMMAPPSVLRGVVVWADGETRVDQLRVRLWSKESESVVFRTRTDSNGMFVVPPVQEGSHYLTIGPVRISLDVLEPRAGVVAQPHSIVIVIPKRLPLSPTLVPSSVLALTAAPSVSSGVLALPEEPLVVSP